MLTKADFQRVIRDSISSYPSIAPLYQAGDPRITQHLDAIASMLAMLSAQVETAHAEPFQKVRDATVLADAAMRGIVPTGRPARARIIATNKGTASFNIDAGRMLLDASGLLWRIETPVTVPNGGAATLEAQQIRKLTIAHTVNASEPFYSVEIPQSDDGDFLCAVTVSDADGEYTYRNRYLNTLPGERVFHIEADDRQRVYVRFGLGGVVGVQPSNGVTINLEIFYTAGKINPSYGSPFSFEYIGSPAEAEIELAMDALLVGGENPISMPTLRDLAKYPSVYDDNAVFLGEFEFLVRRRFPSLKFISVWNEAQEEAVRAASLDNINALFVACLSEQGDEAVRDQPDVGQPVAALKIAETDLTQIQRDIRATILGADDSYRVYFYTPVIARISIKIHAQIPSSYVVNDVREQIISTVLEEFGQASQPARRGRNRPLYVQVYDLLRRKVAALSTIRSDLIVHIDDSEELLARPELWRFVDESSLTVTVSLLDSSAHSWTG